MDRETPCDVPMADRRTADVTGDSKIGDRAP